MLIEDYVLSWKATVLEANYIEAIKEANYLAVKSLGEKSVIQLHFRKGKHKYLKKAFKYFQIQILLYSTQFPFIQLLLMFQNYENHEKPINPEDKPVVGAKKTFEELLEEELQKEEARVCIFIGYNLKCTMEPPYSIYCNSMNMGIMKGLLGSHILD